ncbi:hypothetical protein TRFO_01431 [Tritrichomonas foetus]|uniref:Uncharacterized protein n=1 Tax=Tritrichomonas foetus TaxID=1144522 RepID=A0A1J4JX97_9EUKA|nr:hypothetical protein TRFO_01431 [Tritrichomonas foetus]|eukprot:OHT03775.1 hypothetical protein TRFO_01431 [Tritrichomonas foetus]
MIWLIICLTLSEEFESDENYYPSHFFDIDTLLRSTDLSTVHLFLTEFFDKVNQMSETSYQKSKDLIEYLSRKLDFSTGKAKPNKVYWQSPQGEILKKTLIEDLPKAIDILYKKVKKNVDKKNRAPSLYFGNIDGTRIKNEIKGIRSRISGLSIGGRPVDSHSTDVDNLFFSIQMVSAIGSFITDVFDQAVKDSQFETDLKLCFSFIGDQNLINAKAVRDEGRKSPLLQESQDDSVAINNFLKLFEDPKITSQFDEKQLDKIRSKVVLILKDKDADKYGVRGRWIQTEKYIDEASRINRRKIANNAFNFMMMPNHDDNEKAVKRLLLDDPTAKPFIKWILSKKAEGRALSMVNTVPSSFATPLILREIMNNPPSLYNMYLEMFPRDSEKTKAMMHKFCEFYIKTFGGGIKSNLLSTAGKLQETNLRTVCSISGTTIDIIVGLNAIGLMRPNDGKFFPLLSIASFMQFNYFHSIGEVFSGILTTQPNFDFIKKYKYERLINFFSIASNKYMLQRDPFFEPVTGVTFNSIKPEALVYPPHVIAAPGGSNRALRLRRHSHRKYY